MERRTYRLTHDGVVLGVHFFAVSVHPSLIELREVEEVSCFEFVVPRFARTGLVKEQGFFALGNPDVLVVLNLPEERGEHLGIAFRPAGWDKPPAKEVIAIHELLPRELFVAERVGAGTVGRGCAEGEAVVASFGDVPEILAGRLVSVGGLAALLREIPQRDILIFCETLYGVGCGPLQRHSAALGV